MREPNMNFYFEPRRDKTGTGMMTMTQRLA